MCDHHKYAIHIMCNQILGPKQLQTNQINQSKYWLTFHCNDSRNIFYVFEQDFVCCLRLNDLPIHEYWLRMHTNNETRTWRAKQNMINYRKNRYNCTVCYVNSSCRQLQNKIQIFCYCLGTNVVILNARTIDMIL